MNEILLPNRYGYKNYLVFDQQIDNLKIYHLKLEYPEFGVRMIDSDPPTNYKSLYAIDVPGGFPELMTIGYKINNMVLTELDNNYPPIKLIFKDDEET